MLPPLKRVKRGLRRTTEALAAELACPGSVTPDWNDLEWRLALAAAAAHGVAPLLSHYSAWQHRAWHAFLEHQRAQVEQRHARITALLTCIDAEARSAEVALLALKGSALHAIGLYAPGDRPMADIDLLVRDEQADQAAKLLQTLGYVESFAQWKHRVFKPASGEPIPCLGEHCDTPITIELHTRILERLPISTIDVTQRIFPQQPRPGLNAYPSNAALMTHLLLHAAGNMCSRSLRLVHLNDISLLATRMLANDWDALWHGQESPWWALPPLRLVARYYPNAIPANVLLRLQRDCPPWLRERSRRQTLTQVSCSGVWLTALPGIEWSRSLGEAGRCVLNRLRPTAEAVKERADMIRTQRWLQGQRWVTQKHAMRMLTWLVRPIPRMDTLYVVRAALEYPFTAVPMHESRIPASSAQHVASPCL